MGRHSPCFSPLSLCYPETWNPIACLLHWLSWPGTRTRGGLRSGRTQHIRCVCLTWVVMKTWSWGSGPFPIWADLGEGFSISLTWNAEDESEGDKRSCSFYCGACTESSCIHTQLLGFEGIGSTLFFVWVLALSSLFFPPISVSPALLLGNKYKLAFSHSLTNCHSTSHAHGSVSGICPLEVSLHCC